MDVRPCSLLGSSFVAIGPAALADLPHWQRVALKRNAVKLPGRLLGLGCAFCRSDKIVELHYWPPYAGRGRGNAMMQKEKRCPTAPGCAAVLASCIVCNIGGWGASSAYICGISNIPGF